MFRSRGRDMPENNLRQAMVPVGAAPIPQQPGTAPGLICPLGTPGQEQVIYAVPGVPYEMKTMVNETIIGDLIERSGERAVIRSRVLRTWGLAESGLAEVLADRITELDAAGNPTLAFLASGVEGIKVRVTAKAADDEAAAEILDAEEVRLRQILGDIVFAVDDENMEAVVTRMLAEQGLTIAVAETLTGGYVAGRLTAAPGSAEVFRGGMIQADGARPVSEEASIALAEEARSMFSADVGIATTGIGGPDEAGDLPPGTSCLAVVTAEATRATTVRLPGDRERVRQFSAISLLDLLRRNLQ